MSTPGSCVCGLTEAKRFIGITTSDDDTLIEELIDGVVATIEAYCRRTFGVHTVSRKRDIRTFQDALLLRDYPIISVVAVTDNGAGLTLDTDYYLDATAGVIRKISSFKFFDDGKQKTEIQYVAGYLAIPKGLTLAVKKIVSRFYNNRDGLLSEKIGSYGYSQKLEKSGFTPEESLMLKPYRRIGGMDKNA